MAYLINQFIIGIMIFVILLIMSIIGLRIKTVIIHELTRHSRTGDTCPLSMDLIIVNTLRRATIVLRGFYAYITMYFIRDDGSVIQFFRGYIPSLSNTWRIMDFSPSIRLFNLAVSSDGIGITDILIPYPSSLELPGSLISPFDIRTGEPTGVVNFLSIRRALSSELGEKLVQSMSLAEIVRRIKLDISFYNGVNLTKYSTSLLRLLANAGIQVDGEVRVIEGSVDTNLRKVINCPYLFSHVACLGKAFRTTWVWLTIIEAILGLAYAFIPSLFVLLIGAPIIYVLVILLLSLPRIT
ncbi:hypothetical protein VMUT_1563 [Vulcanisaeta moutnovskia 768-28]|uniref:Uncharacterized protein n=1 Tax=Vulcanisaeta moutnovskia (strain 768-28) TaxID=985053 RepID=F0QTY1_VULM7|nr:hypothetical protein [Vulcanisaeta moutnovskia]ADY01767.1 hypothetical protein VMUT_1563 [Vulcanisaeta moutnovskia 768-28]